jgi:hypothetical protein
MFDENKNINPVDINKGYSIKYQPGRKNNNILPIKIL